MASLWKILAGIGGVAAAPFTGGTSLGLVFPAISAGVGSSLLSAGINDKGSGGSSKTSDELSIDALVGRQSDISKRFLKEGQDLSRSGEDTVDFGLKHLTKILSGDRTAVMESVAPEFDEILKQYDTGRRTIMDTGPRGGAKGEKVAESYFMEADAKSRLLQTIRRMVAGEVTRAGESRAQRGIAREVSGVQSIDSIIASLTQKRGQNLQTYGDIGQGIGSIVAAMLMKGKSA